MAIEFRCTQCGRLLRTPDDTAGKQAQCPECGAISTVPMAAPGYAGAPPAGGGPFAPGPGAGPGTPFGPGAPPGGAVQGENPYQSPTQYGPAQPAYDRTAATAAAAGRVSGPATALIVAAALGLAARLFGILFNLVPLHMNMNVGFGGRPQNMFPMMVPAGLAIVMDMVGIGLGVLVIWGAVKMKNLENYSLAMAVSILAMIPCISPCCLLGLPFGIWALVVLNDPMVKAAFRS